MLSSSEVWQKRVARLNMSLEVIKDHLSIAPQGIQNLLAHDQSVLQPLWGISVISNVAIPSQKFLRELPIPSEKFVEGLPILSDSSKQILHRVANTFCPILMHLPEGYNTVCIGFAYYCTMPCGNILQYIRRKNLNFKSSQFYLFVSHIV